MREVEIENYLRGQVRKSGGKAYKFTSPGNNGVPDRIVIFPKGRIYFVELKAPGKKLSRIQNVKITELRKLGCSVHVIDNKVSVDKFITTVSEECGT